MAKASKKKVTLLANTTKGDRDKAEARIAVNKKKAMGKLAGSKKNSLETSKTKGNIFQKRAATINKKAKGS